MTVVSGANWRNNTDDDKSMSKYIVFLLNALVIFMVRLRELAAQSTMESELVVVALALKEAAFCPRMMEEL